MLANHLTDATEIPPCAMRMDSPHKAVSDSLLSICSEIWKHQGVSDLWMWAVKCDSLTPPRLTNPGTVRLSQCKFLDVFVEKILHQLFGCAEYLQRLELEGMNLKPFESLLDELLEDLVAHHEAGSVQRRLRLRGDGHIQPSKLSEEFKEKWWNRCWGIDSIDCVIGDIR